MAEPDPEPDAWCDDVVDTEGDGGTLSVLEVWERCMRGGIDVEVVMGEERLVLNGGRMVLIVCISDERQCAYSDTYVSLQSLRKIVGSSGIHAYEQIDLQIRWP